MKEPKSPCYNCEDRKIGCHSDCGKYLDYKLAIKEFNKLIKSGRIEDRKMEDLKWLVYHQHHKGTQRP